MTSVTDILKKHGKWLQTSVLVKKISEEEGISERQAYRRISKALKKKEIRRATKFDGTVCYGLQEFEPLASTTESDFQEAFILQCFKQLHQINEKASTGNSFQALQELCSLIKTLPTNLKDKLNSDVQQAKQAFFPYFELCASLEELKTNAAYQNNVRVQLFQVIVNSVAKGQVEYLVEKVSTLLHQQIRGDKEILADQPVPAAQTKVISDQISLLEYAASLKSEELKKILESVSKLSFEKHKSVS